MKCGHNHARVDSGVNDDAFGKAPRLKQIADINTNIDYETVNP